MNPFEATTRSYNLTTAIRLATSASSAATTNALGVYEVALFATEDTWVTLAVTPTAAVDTAGNIFLAAGVLYHIRVNPGHKLAAIQDSAAGAVHIIPVG